MVFFQATNLLGTFHTIAHILISVRKCHKAKKNIDALVGHCLSSLDNIKKTTPQVAQFVELGGIGLEEFCTIAAKITKIEDELTNLRAKLNKMKQIHRFCSATEISSTLESIRCELHLVETGIQLLITSVESNVKASVLLVALEPVLSLAEELMPNTGGAKEALQLLADARKEFGPHVLASRMNRLITRSSESVYYLIMGKMFFEGMAVDVDYEKSASFFQFAIRYGDREACAYLGRQYQQGLGVREDVRKAVEYYRKGANQDDPDCLFEMGQCFKFGYGLQKDSTKKLQYYTKAANVGHVGAQKAVAHCLEAGIGTEADLVQAAKYYKAAAEAGDVDALCQLARSFLYGMRNMLLVC